MEVKIYRIDKSLPLPKYETAGSCAFDFIVREDTEILANSLTLIPTNVIIECPKNLALFVLPRSSTFRKKQLIFPHSIGLIDQDYCGPKDEIFLQVHNLSNKNITISRGERIAQGLFVNISKVKFTEIENLAKNSRGGFGSTD